ncbi:MAG: hypothetical protein ACRDA3_13795 [Peptostreptococcaceae bacterium]
MIQYLIKRKVKKEVEEKGKKVLIYTGAIAAGIGIYASYKIIKNHKQKNQDEDSYYLSNNEFDLYDYEDEEYSKEEEELEEKIDEFNSRRLNCDNCTQISQTDMNSYIDSIEDTKDEIQIDKEDYKEDKYDEYEYIEEDLENK